MTINQFIEAFNEMDRLEEEMTDKKDLPFDNTASSIMYALNNSNLTTNNQHLTHQQQLLPGHPGHHPNNSPYQLTTNLSNHHYNSLPHNHQSQPQLTNTFQSSDDNIELMNFKKKGEQAMLLEIRQFVSKYNVRQSMISEATGKFRKFSSFLLSYLIKLRTFGLH